ncbi:MAG: undecaprenyl diphosphate synthase family protein, partial [Candidatus Aenigmarchaeota archaeon]|nr:undecaprenyl diphosphate synthase family protein [Candidatus Aenigmarchaeota archaeon]
KRLSGFMLYQAAYSEIFFVEKMWPSFTTKDMDEVMKEYRQRSRRFGK